MKIDEILNEWRNNKGKGWLKAKHSEMSTYLSTGGLFQALLTKIYPPGISYKHDANILIVCESQGTMFSLYKLDIVRELVSNGVAKVYDEGFAQTHLDTIFRYNYNYVITLGHDILPEVYLNTGKFHFSIAYNCECDIPQLGLGELGKEPKVSIKAATGSNTNLIRNYRDKPPVEERRVRLNMLSDDWEIYKQYRDYISKSVAIFGGDDIYKVIDSIRNGDIITGKSAEQVKLDIAYFNGWRYDLDMNYAYNVDIDMLYSPLALTERANILFDITHKRDVLLTDNHVKIDAVIKIIKDNPNKSILIVNKRADFCNPMVEAINEHIAADLSGYAVGFHDKLEPIEVIGKSGNPKIIKSAAQMSRNMELFNTGLSSVLVCKNAADKKLQCSPDVIVFTSPLCDTLDQFLYRLSNIKPKTKPIQVIRLYIADTKEEQKLNGESIQKNVTIVNNCEDSDDSTINSVDFVCD